MGYNKSAEGGITILIAKDLSKTYGAFTALNHISFEIPQGQIVGLLGINGAGKTTLLNILTGCTAPTCGYVSYDNISLEDDPLAYKARISYMPEIPPLYEELTVGEYIRHICLLKGIQKKAVPEYADNILHSVGLDDVSKVVIRRLSKGYRQRAGLAQALCGDPQIIFLDEPTSGLDPVQADEFKSHLRRLCQGKTIVFSTHQLHEAAQLCSRILILHQGKIIVDRLITDDSSLSLIVRISCSKKDLKEKLLSVKGVQKAELLHRTDSEQTWRLRHERQASVEEDLFGLCAAMSTPILRLYPEKDSLEDIFLNVARQQEGA